MGIASTLNDQFSLCGPEPSSLEAFLVSLEKATQKPGLSLLWSSMKPYLFHVTCLARQLSETINGGRALAIRTPTTVHPKCFQTTPASILSQNPPPSNASPRALSSTPSSPYCWTA
ncbi:hypothetical protein DFH09DRAFT_1320886 [Mycena vulgaris]|nr:hypothetical protein DFH09DRAFT_1320886 [Mycena vulgaris]